MIVKDLKEKYWDSIYQQMVAEGLYKCERIREEYRRIYRTECPEIIPAKQPTFHEL